METATRHARGDQGIEAEFWRGAAYIAACAPARSWGAYEQLKGLYDRRFPGATCKQRDAAMTRIAKLTGV